MKKQNAKIFVCGDTHGRSQDTKKLNGKNFPEQKELTKQDVVIQLGDFGWVWYYNFENNKEQEYWLDWFAEKNYTLAVVLGNHENYDIIERLPWIQKWGNQVQVLKRKGGEIYFLKRGAIYKINGRKILTIGGAYSIDKAFRTLGVSWWTQEELSSEEIERCLNEIEQSDKQFDYILTHTCPSYIIPKMTSFSMKNNCSVAKFLQHIDSIVKFKEWHFGHFHLDREIEKGKYRCHYENAPFELE